MVLNSPRLLSAVSFDGTNDSVSIADHADFTFGSGDFTMEAFVYNRSSGYRSIVQSMVVVHQHHPGSGPCIMGKMNFIIILVVMNHL